MLQSWRSTRTECGAKGWLASANGWRSLAAERLGLMFCPTVDGLEPPLLGHGVRPRVDGRWSLVARAGWACHCGRGLAKRSTRDAKTMFGRDGSLTRMAIGVAARARKFVSNISAQTCLESVQGKAQTCE